MKVKLIALMPRVVGGMLTHHEIGRLVSLVQGTPAPQSWRRAEETCPYCRGALRELTSKMQYGRVVAIAKQPDGDSPGIGKVAVYEDVRLLNCEACAQSFTLPR